MAAAARTKVGYVLRDLLFDRYRSSSKAKVARRRAKRLQLRVESSSVAVPNSDTIKHDKGLPKTKTTKVQISPQNSNTDDDDSISSSSASVPLHGLRKAHGGYGSSVTPFLEQVLRRTTNPRTEAIFTAPDQQRGKTSDKAKRANTTTAASPLEAVRLEALVAAYGRILGQGSSCIHLPSVCSPPHQQVPDYGCSPTPLQTQQDDFPDDLSDIFEP